MQIRALLILWREIDTPAHKCLPKQLYSFTREEEETDQILEIFDTTQEESQECDGEISMHALTRNIIHHTIKIQGMIKKKTITISLTVAAPTTSWILALWNKLAV